MVALDGLAAVRHSNSVKRLRTTAEDEMSDEVKKPPSEYQLIGPAEDGRRISDPLAGKTAAKESQQRPQALIAEWLRMENLVVLAGVGGGLPCKRIADSSSVFRRPDQLIFAWRLLDFIRHFVFCRRPETLYTIAVADSG